MVVPSQLGLPSTITVGRTSIKLEEMHHFLGHVSRRSRANRRLLTSVGDVVSMSSAQGTSTNTVPPPPPPPSTPPPILSSFGASISSSLGSTQSSSSVTKDSNNLLKPKTFSVQINRNKPSDRLSSFFPTRHTTNENGEVDKNKLLRNLQHQIHDSRIRDQPTNALAAAMMAKDNQIALEMKDYITVLWACTMMKESDRADEAFRIYDLLKSSNSLPIIVFERIASVCYYRKHYDKLLDVIEDYKKLGYEFNETFLTTIIKVLTTAKPRQLRSNYESIMKYYKIFRELSKELNWESKTTSVVYFDVAVASSKVDVDGACDDVIMVLHDMIEAGIEPQVQMCKLLLDSSSLYMELDVIKIISSWYLNNFNETLEEGIMYRFSHIAACSGDPELAHVVTQLRAKYDYPVDAHDHLSIIRAYTNAEIDKNVDIVGLTDYLLDSQKKGIYDSLAKNPMHIKSLINEQIILGLKLSKHPRSLNELYFSLVDLVRSTNGVPIFIVNSIIIAYGKIFKPDQAFATFQECKTLFGMAPDILTYNALLLAVSFNHNIETSTVLQIFEDMENNNVKADDTSFSLLIDNMIENNNFDSLDAIFTHMDTTGVTLPHRLYRKLLIFLAKNKKLSEFESIKNKFEATSGSRLPGYLSHRLKTVSK